MSDYLFHYTSVKAICSIISSQLFRATNMTTFDDENELFGGLNPIQCCLDQIKVEIGLNGLTTFHQQQISELLSKESMYKFFCISFCKEGDYKFMWEKYASNEGCLVFDKTQLLNCFLSDPLDFLKPREHKYSVAFKDFIACVYLPENDIHSYIVEHLKKLDLSVPKVFVQRLTWNDVRNPEKILDDSPCVDVTKNFLELIKPALVLKYAGTEKEYEKEHETRIVFCTPCDTKEISTSKKSYIELMCNASRFFKALRGIKICPDAANKNALREQLDLLNCKLLSNRIVDAPISIL